MYSFFFILLCGRLLRTHCIKHIDGIAENAVDHIHRIRDRCVHAAHKLCNKLFARRERSKRPYLIRLDDLALDGTDLDRQDPLIVELILLNVVADDLRRSDCILC